ncbi:response regulator transcription factor [Cupriavidus pauculus]|uniref:response regulator transcription factor n=1 Tax=Cupriavidus pauculus TaxID=82633 RepID=UPI001FD59286|nr:response regulator transcription factor [Cupriavidus pauculus]
MPTALVIDPHPAICRAVSSVLADHLGFDEVRVAENGTRALRSMRERTAELVMVDLQLPDVPGDAVLEELVSTCPASRILVLSAMPHVAERALLCGAHGFVDKGAGLAGLAEAVRAIMSGYTVFPLSTLPRLRRSVMNPADPTQILSRRELTVMRFLAAGHSNKAISDVLGISNKTVSSHKTSIMAKLGCDSLIDMAEFARRHQLAW